MLTCPGITIRHACTPFATPTPRHGAPCYCAAIAATVCPRLSTCRCYYYMFFHATLMPCSQLSPFYPATIYTMLRGHAELRQYLLKEMHLPLYARTRDHARRRCHVARQQQRARHASHACCGASVTRLDKTRPLRQSTASGACACTRRYYA